MSPGSVWIGSIQSTSLIPALQRGHAGVPCLFSNSDTNVTNANMIRTPRYRLHRLVLFYDASFVLWNLRLNHGRFPMPIRAYLDGQKLDGETIRQVGIAFEMALASLRLRRPHS